jgi:ABC-type oligopeptide transport system ATPase subunit
MNKRNGELIVLIGENGTGKTTYSKHLLKFNKRALIIPANQADSITAWADIPEIPVDGILKKVTGLGPLDWELLNDKKNRDLKHKMFLFMFEIFQSITGAYKINIPSRRKILFEMIVHDELGFINGHLQFDDFKSYIPGLNNPPQYIVQWVGDRRMKNLDIVLAAHTPNEIPPLFFGKGPTIVLWKTGRSFATAKDKIGETMFPVITAAQKRINAKPKAQPNGSAPVISPYEVIQIPQTDFE